MSMPWAADIFSDTDEMPFGKHSGMQLKDVPANYLLWLADQEDFAEKNGNGLSGLSKYIEDRREVLVAKKKAESKAYFEAKKKAEEQKNNDEALKSGKVDVFDDDIDF